MSKRLPKKKTVAPQLNRSPWIYFLFLFSGIASLIYQVVWVRMLTLVFGHTIYSVSIVLSAFMAGLGLGSYLWGKTIDKTGKAVIGIRENRNPVLASRLHFFLSSYQTSHLFMLGCIKLLPDLSYF